MTDILDWQGKTLHVVMGRRKGSEKHDWPVAAYFNQRAADDHARKAAAWVMDNHQRHVEEDRVNPYDTSTSAAVTRRTMYVVIKIPAVFEGADGVAQVMTAAPAAVFDRHQRQIDVDE